MTSHEVEPAIPTPEQIPTGPTAPVSEEVVQEPYLNPEQYKLWESGQDIVDIHARRYKLPGKIIGLDEDDLKQVGQLGLMRAAHNFREEEGVQFATLATSLIRGTIFNAIRDYQTPKNRPAYESRKKIGDAIDSLKEQLHRDPTVEEIAKKSEVKPETIKAHFETSNVRSLDRPIGTDDGTSRSLIDTLAVDDRGIELTPDLVDLLERMKKLTPQKQMALAGFALGRTQTEIALVLGLSQPYTGRLIKQAMAEMHSDLRVVDEDTA
jgi:RNA polymerase sigma factor (sigma-70 family)